MEGILDSFDKSIGFYQEISWRLSKVSEYFPFDVTNYGKLNELNDDSINAAKLLKEVREIWEKALNSLYKLHSLL
jgi:hypothetical protein